MITLALLTKYLNTCLARVWRALQAAGPSRTQMFPRSTRAGGKKPFQATRREARGAGVSEASAPAHAPAQKSPGPVGGEEGAGL